MKSTLNSEYFEKKDQSHRLSITEIITAKLVATEMSKRPLTAKLNIPLNFKAEMSKRPSFMQRFGSQDGNGSPTLLRSAGNHFYTAIPLI